MNAIYALGHYNIPLMFDIEPVAPFNTINLLYNTPIQEISHL